MRLLEHDLGLVRMVAGKQDVLADDIAQPAFGVGAARQFGKQHAGEILQRLEYDDLEEILLVVEVVIERCGLDAGALADVA